MVLDAKGIACDKAVCEQDKTAGMREGRTTCRGGGKQRDLRGSLLKAYMGWVFFSVFMCLSPEWDLEGGGAQQAFSRVLWTELVWCQVLCRLSLERWGLGTNT